MRRLSWSPRTHTVFTVTVLREFGEMPPPEPDSGRLDGHREAFTQCDVGKQSPDQRNIGANVGPTSHVDGGVGGRDVETNSVRTSDGPSRHLRIVRDRCRTRAVAHHVDEANLFDQHFDHLETTEQNDEHQREHECEFDRGLSAVARRHGTRDITLSIT